MSAWGRPWRPAASKGVRNNLSFLAAVAEHPDFKAGQVDTTWIEREREALLAAMP